MSKEATTATSKSAIGYEYYNKLFALERKLDNLTPKRQEEAHHGKKEFLLDTFWSWVEKLEPTRGSKLAEAETYAKGQKQYLNTFLEHGEVDISNNTAENAIRLFVVGRKNWLFSDTPKGVDSSAIVYTMLESANNNGLEPYLYLRRLLVELSFFESTPSAAELEAFMP